MRNKKRNIRTKGRLSKISQLSFQEVITAVFRHYRSEDITSTSLNLVKRALNMLLAKSKFLVVVVVVVDLITLSAQQFAIKERST